MKRGYCQWRVLILLRSIIAIITIMNITTILYYYSYYHYIFFVYISSDIAALPGRGLFPQPPGFLHLPSILSCSRTPVVEMQFLRC